MKMVKWFLLGNFSRKNEKFATKNTKIIFLLAHFSTEIENIKLKIAKQILHRAIFRKKMKKSHEKKQNNFFPCQFSRENFFFEKTKGKKIEKFVCSQITKFFSIQIENFRFLGHFLNNLFRIRYPFVTKIKNRYFRHHQSIDRPN